MVPVQVALSLPSKPSGKCGGCPTSFLETKVSHSLTFVVPDRPSSTVRPLLFVPGSAPGASFVAVDRRVLHARVPLVEVVPRPGLGHAAFAGQLGRVLANERPARAVVWFAAATYGTSTLAACRLARVPCLVIAGGMDVAACPEIGFGEARGGWRRRASRWVLEQAALVWAFSESAHREIASRARPRAVAVVPPAVDTTWFRPASPAPVRQRLVLSTCAAIGPVAIAQKGLDRLVRAAEALADVPVVITGAVDTADPGVRAFVAGAPPNVSFAGHVSREALRDLNGRAAVVAQLSRHEGFGVAAAEAAAMGCALVTTDLPVFDEVLGCARVRVPLDAPDADVAAALRRALDDGPPAPRWADIDRRYGVAVRTAAWDAWLTREGLLPPVRGGEGPR
jgi:glycosyltransferase involved in cell wall biosynthesis